jgi:hypothetical protein
LPSPTAALQFDAAMKEENAMGKSLVDESPAPTSPEGRLDSWKDIAAHLNRDVTTVQRWEKREGMPVHRHLHDKMGSVYAFRTELDVWVRSRRPRASQEIETAGVPTAPAGSERLATSTFRATRTFVLGLATAGVALALGASLWLRETEFFWRSPIARRAIQESDRLRWRIMLRRVPDVTTYRQRKYSKNENLVRFSSKAVSADLHAGHCFLTIMLGFRQL